jgi:hypothetical protein
LISFTDGKAIKRYGKIQDAGITGIVITADEKFLFTCSVRGILKQWNYGDMTLVREYRKIADGIYSLCP